MRNIPIKNEDNELIGQKWSDYCEYIGTVSGTYECSGTGTKNCTVTITVTELPETITEIEKNKPLVFLTWDHFVL